MARHRLSRNDVVLISFPFTDLSAQKVRPALIVSRVEGEDTILAFITSHSSHDPSGAPSTHRLDPAHLEFRITGLKTASTIRLDKLATLNHSLIRRKIGRIGDETRQAVASCLRFVFEI